MEQQLPPCFGVLWQAVRGKYCHTCAIRNECLIEFAAVRLPAAQGFADSGLDSLVEELGIPLEAVLLALNYQATGQLPAPITTHAAPIDPGPPDSSTAHDGSNLPDSGQNADDPGEGAAPPKKPKKKAGKKRKTTKRSKAKTAKRKPSKKKAPKSKSKKKPAKKRGS